MGFSREAPTVLEFPLEMFLPASDLTPLQENLDKVIYGLTKWQPSLKGSRTNVPAKLTVAGKDYEEATANMNNLFLRRSWSDGLGLTPPTESRVGWILTGTPLPRDTMIGKILPPGGIATVETLAVCLAMAGGRPEYLPVLIAAIEAIVEPGFRHQHLNTTTCSVYPAVIVNGPVAKQIRLSSGYGCLGPNPAHSAGAAIGRAIRLILLIVGGAVPGVGTMSIYGGANRYTNVVFAEDEDGLPPGWEPLNVSYFGSVLGTNTVTVQPVSSTVNVQGAAVGDQESALATLYTMAGFMGTPNWNYWAYIKTFEESPGVVLMARGTVQGLVKLGWTRGKVQDFLWENSKVPWSTIERTCRPGKLDSKSEIFKPYVSRNQPWPIASRPKNIMIVVAGGEQSGHAYWMQIGASHKPTCKEIRLPSNWDQLLDKAEKDLGPLSRVG